jgi:predicted solute-binding protein
LHEFKRNELERKIRVAAVSYLNTKPLIYGFEKGMMHDEIDLVTDFPASIADMLMRDEVDISLVPVATIPSLNEYHIITDYCIGTTGEVASVCLFSDVPLEEIQTILLDYGIQPANRLLSLADHPVALAIQTASADAVAPPRALTRDDVYATLTTMLNQVVFGTQTPADAVTATDAQLRLLLEGTTAP